MKLLVILSIVIVFITNSQAEKYVSLAFLSEQRIPSAKDIVAKIEELRNNLINKGYDPLNLEEYQLSLNQFGFNLNLAVTGNLTGQLKFIINEISGHIFTYKYDITFPKIDIEIDPYDLTGFLQMIKVFGKGQLRLNLNGLNIAGDIKLTPVSGIKIKKITTNIKLGKPFFFQITGWLNDEYRSAMLTDVINNNFLDILEMYKVEINNKLGEVLTNLVKDIVIPIS